MSTILRKGGKQNGPVKQLQHDPSKGPKDDKGAYAIVPPPVFKSFELEQFLFDKQLKFVNDPRPFKTAVCSRRSGKTVACAADLINTAISNEGVVCIYITLARANAKKLIWRDLKKINSDYALGAEEDATELSLTFPNNSIIYLTGAKDSSEIEKFRGLPMKLVYIDECGSFRDYIRELIDDILEPALLDYAGTLCLIGTPPAIPSGYFHECATKSDAWTNHHWTFFDNPFITAKSGKSHQELLDRVLKRRGVTADDPGIQREYFGRWVLDSDSLWIHYDKTKADYTFMPDVKPLKYNYMMGIDLGFNDADALAVIAWADNSPITYLVEEIVIPRQGITELVEQIQYLQSKYDIAKMVIDEGGLGKKVAEEIRRRHHIPVQPADKARKQENVAFLNDALRTGRFKARADSKFVHDSYLVEVDRDKSTPDRIKLSDKYHSDIIDAVLYAFKESPAFSYTPPDPKPQVGTKAWADSQQSAMWEEAQKHFEEQVQLKRALEGYDD